ncbi:uncharacterized protein LOC114755189 [Neltuma alba]|uniref:uncharacterized protein LOC114755189 n=1 Tax=Neltuma alba TaxID=207710 RepID=UPI0010A4226A|nr:uncharacterized protein LOC114755189 [Prosopis alba]
MERSPTPPQEEEHEVKVLESPPEKAIFYIHHPSRFLLKFLKPLLKCLGFDEISVRYNDDPKSLNRLSCGAVYPNGCNNHAAAGDQDYAVPSSPPQASDPSAPPTDQPNGTIILLVSFRSGRPGPTPGPGPQTN